ncbi:MAG: Cof-type HAD-IIB family hydrolase [Actinomycetota bacterium]|nr:Cof-type HAD-IIB family hydrolase [Actinomycetota bacterium]
MTKLIATDLDGTLVGSDGRISERTKAALLLVESKGVEVVFVTGRPLRWAEEVFSYVGTHGLAIVSNGALVWDVAMERPVLVRAIEPVIGLEVCELILSAVAGSSFAVETLAGLALEPEFVERHPVPSGARRGPIAEIFDAPAVKLLARHEQLPAQEFWDLAQAAAGDRVVITWSSDSAMLEISAAGVTKASTLALVCAGRGVVAEEVVAFGDMPNDIAMLTWAGTSYAMANAHPSVLAAAAAVTASNDDDGVAAVLERLAASL